MLDKLSTFPGSLTSRKRSADDGSTAEEWIFFALLALVTLLVMLELLSLYSMPVPDSYLWWGDESWLMLEFRTQILTGIFRHPYALGSSLAQGSGMIFGNMWIPALFYGIPAALVSPVAMDIVLLGRTVTAIFAFTLLVALFEIVQRLTSDRVLAMFSVLLLVTSRSFLLTSHSARYDILSALAIIAGVYLLLRYGTKLNRPRHAAIAGFLTGATLLMTIHVTLALALAACVTVVYQARGNWLKSLLAFAGGAAAFVLLLIGITALRGQPIVGRAWNGAFALNLHDIPALRLYSRSVQCANLIQRWGTLVAFGRGYIIVFATLAILAIIQSLRKSVVWRNGWHGIILLLVLLSWLEFESAAPTSYLIYMLPVLALVAALVMKRLSSEAIRIWITLGLGVVLAVIAIADTPGAHGKGYQLLSNNYQAVGAALDQIEQADSSSHPLVLAFNPAVHEILRDTNVRLMTTHFVEFPVGTLNVDSVLQAEHVNYALVYLSALKPDYMREVGPIMTALRKTATPLWERAGYFTDIDRSYFDSRLSAPDTIRLYRINY